MRRGVGKVVELLRSENGKNVGADICLALALLLAYFTWVHQPATRTPDSNAEVATYRLPSLEADVYESYSTLEASTSASSPSVGVVTQVPEVKTTPSQPGQQSPRTSASVNSDTVTRLAQPTQTVV